MAAGISHFANNQVGNNVNLSDYNALIDKVNTSVSALSTARTPVSEGTQGVAGTMTLDFALGDANNFLATFGAGDLTIANPINVSPGQRGFLSLKQDSVGSRVVTAWGGNWKFAGATAPTLTTTAAASDLIEFYAVTASVIVAWLVSADYR